MESYRLQKVDTNLYIKGLSGPLVFRALYGILAAFLLFVVLYISLGAFIAVMVCVPSFFAWLYKINQIQKKPWPCWLGQETDGQKAALVHTDQKTDPPNTTAMTNTMNVKPIEQALPLLGFNEDLLVSNNLDMGFGLKLQLPELLSCSREQLYMLHDTFQRAVNLLPVGTLLHKQDFFFVEHFDGMAGNGRQQERAPSLDDSYLGTLRVGLT